MHLLLVEDDRGLAALVRKGLQEERYVVDVAHSGDEALDLAMSTAYDGMVLDLMLPVVDGLAIARRLRAVGQVTPILMLTARDTLPDRLMGFEAGADDYLCKPFAFEELRARLRAILRRGSRAPEEDRLVVGDLVLDRVSHEVTRADRPITLAPKEYALLEFLMRHPGQVLSRTVLLERVWDYSFQSFANVVDATVYGLRKALDQGGAPTMIHTVRGTGYKLKA
jgi:DNA-binding response OmpR family regulator